VKQPLEGVTYAHKIEKAEAAINWHDTAETIDRRVRAFNPFPAATAQRNGEVIKLWRASPESSNSADKAAPGTVLSADAQGVRIACGDGVLCVTELQRAGGKRLAAAEFLRGYSLSAGQQFALTTD
jgi:methionyl-tRNA formyltransferase